MMQLQKNTLQLLLEYFRSSFSTRMKHKEKQNLQCEHTQSVPFITKPWSSNKTHWYVEEPVIIIISSVRHMGEPHNAIFVFRIWWVVFLQSAFVQRNCRLQCALVTGLLSNWHWKWLRRQERYDDRKWFVDDLWLRCHLNGFLG